MITKIKLILVLTLPVFTLFSGIYSLKNKLYITIGIIMTNYNKEMEFGMVVF